MPNWCFNKLDIVISPNGKPEFYDELKEKLKSESEDLTFGKILPEPECFKAQAEDFFGNTDEESDKKFTFHLDKAKEHVKDIRIEPEKLLVKIGKITKEEMRRTGGFFNSSRYVSKATDFATTHEVYNAADILDLAYKDIDYSKVVPMSEIYHIVQGILDYHNFMETGLFNILAWRLYHWGVKWDASDSNFVEGVIGNGFKSASYTFLTAWGGAVYFIEALAKLIKEDSEESEIRYVYLEDGNGVGGIYHWKPDESFEEVESTTTDDDELKGPEYDQNVRALMDQIKYDDFGFDPADDDEEDYEAMAEAIAAEVKAKIESEEKA